MAGGNRCHELCGRASEGERGGTYILHRKGQNILASPYLLVSCWAGITITNIAYILVLYSAALGKVVQVPVMHRRFVKRVFFALSCNFCPLKFHGKFRDDNSAKRTSNKQNRKSLFFLKKQKKPFSSFSCVPSSSSFFIVACLASLVRLSIYCCNCWQGGQSKRKGNTIQKGREEKKGQKPKRVNWDREDSRTLYGPSSISCLQESPFTK